jgi:adenylosuccinate synthase
LDEIEVIYETMPGWKTDISNCKKFEDLPQEAQRYLKRVQELAGFRIKWVGIGAGRTNMIEINF